ncbi:metallophosphoesterase [Streptomyces sp. ISL-36]|uniref:metallophosphoesterase family protein n=1 Tax=Streptomyces sp. ISL-36 TaxID=2819182 RepID=UPI001BE66287|nr:metallophosphoesterase [Streptomyces sp. ISL-36]MBT2442568.1 metallophosphoesterase [Streptomyces sp. ISL-36]
MSGGSLLAISDLHVAYEENDAALEALRPRHADDWLILAGDVGEIVSDIERALRLLSERFAKVVWVPGNHELWTHPRDPVTLRGVARYEHLVGLCRAMGVVTPEDPFPVWQGPRGPVTVAPLFLLYDYSFRQPGVHDEREALELAAAHGVVCADEALIHPEPYAGAGDWCRARLESTERRLDALGPDVRTILVNHFPLVREPTRVLRHPDFALWCGTGATADWHVRFRATAVVYGHLHIPRTTWHDGVRFEEVSMGYPREWRRRGGGRPAGPRLILAAHHDPVKETT